MTFLCKNNMAVLAVIRLKAQGLPWTELMDAAMVAVHSQQDRTAADIRAACVRVPMQHRMHEVCPVMPIHLMPCAVSWAAQQHKPNFTCLVQKSGHDNPVSVGCMSNGLFPHSLLLM